MDTSKERIEALKKCKNFQKYLGGVRLIRIDEHLEILKEKGYYLGMFVNREDKGWVELFKESVLLKDFEAPTLEMALDLACEWALNHKESK